MNGLVVNPGKQQKIRCRANGAQRAAEIVSQCGDEQFPRLVKPGVVRTDRFPMHITDSHDAIDALPDLLRDADAGEQGERQGQQL